jgi:hypothetical protein
MKLLKETVFKTVHKISVIAALAREKHNQSLPVPLRGVVS